MKANKNKSNATIENSLMQFKRTNKNEWVDNALFGAGISTIGIFIISLAFQF